MRRVTLQLRVRSEPRQRIWLRLGQVVEVGSSDAADICIPDDPFVEPIHVSIAHQRMGCFCECLVDSAELRVNEQLCRRKRLKDRDVISFGNCDVEVSIEAEAVPRFSANLELGGLASETSLAGNGGLPDAELRGSSPIDLDAGNEGPPDLATAPATRAGPLPVVANGSSPIVVTAEFLPLATQAPAPVSLSATAAPPDVVLADVNAGRDANAATSGDNVEGEHPSATETPPIVPGGSEYATEKLAGNIWRYHPSPEAGLDLETVVGRLAELFDTFLVLSPSTAARLANQRLLPDRMAEINVNMSLIENPDLSATLTLLRGEPSRQEVMLIASRSGLHELAANLQEHAFTFGRPSIFTMQVSVAHRSLLEQFMYGKVAVLTTESGQWDLYSMVDPNEEYQFLGFDRPPVLMY